MASEHAQNIADKLAQDRYGKEFHQLSADIQDSLFWEARQIAEAEIIQTFGQRKGTKNV